MRLLDTRTLYLTEWMGQRPPYAILSHTWDDDEVTFDDVYYDRPGYREKKGFAKILKTCEIARKEGIGYAWVDTCCINKSSSSELAEAINSMFRWYEAAQVCYAYFSDLHPDSPTHEMRHCRWFGRGWTLQELVASENVRFYDSGWTARDTKARLRDYLAEVTSIDAAVLEDRSTMHSIPVCRRMAWAADRSTTRAEDRAYCLLGIFNVHLPLIYGEGDRAFLRLQEEIIRQYNDLTIFAWLSDHQDLAAKEVPGLPVCGPLFHGVLARTPRQFRGARDVKVPRGINDTPEFTLTNKGVRMSVAVAAEDDRHILPLGCFRQDRPIGIYLQLYGPGLYVRVRHHEFAELADDFEGESLGEPLPRYLTTHQHSHNEIYRSRTAMRHRAFMFRGAFEHDLYAHESATPDAWWDPDLLLYYYYERSFVAAHVFKCRWEGADDRFLVAFGVGMVEGTLQAWVSVATRRTHPGIFEMVLRRKMKAIQAIPTMTLRPSVTLPLWGGISSATDRAGSGDNGQIKTFTVSVTLVDGYHYGVPTYFVGMDVTGLDQTASRIEEAGAPGAPGESLDT